MENLLYPENSKILFLGELKSPSRKKGKNKTSSKCQRHKLPLAYSFCVDLSYL